MFTPVSKLKSGIFSIVIAKIDWVGVVDDSIYIKDLNFDMYKIVVSKSEVQKRIISTMKHNAKSLLK